MALKGTFKWGYKIIEGPFDGCDCPSHCESREYPISDFESGLAFLTYGEAVFEGEK